MFPRLILITFIFTGLTLSAQDYGPVKVDLEEYVDDSKLEKHVDEADKKDPPTEVKDPESDKKDPEVKDPKTNRTDRSRTRPVKPIVPRDIKPLSSINFKKETDPMLYIYIGGGVLVVIVIVAVVIIKKKGSSTGSKKADAILNNLGDEADQVVETSSSTGGDGNQGVTTAEGIKTSYDVQERFEEDTRIDDRGRNPSGVIIDEDMYFAEKSAGSFIDEDLEGGEGPDISELN